MKLLINAILPSIFPRFATNFSPQFDPSTDLANWRGPIIEIFSSRNVNFRRINWTAASFDEERTKRGIVGGDGTLTDKISMYLPVIIFDLPVQSLNAPVQPG